MYACREEGSALVIQGDMAVANSYCSYAVDTVEIFRLDEMIVLQIQRGCPVKRQTIRCLAGGPYIFEMDLQSNIRRH